MVAHFGVSPSQFSSAQADDAAGGPARPAPAKPTAAAKPKVQPPKQIGTKPLAQAKALDAALKEHRQLLVGGKPVDPHVALRQALDGMTKIAVRFTSMNADFKKQAQQHGTAAADAKTYADLSDKSLTNALKAVSAQNLEAGYLLMRAAIHHTQYACAILAAVAEGDVRRADAEMLAVQITADGCFAAAGVLSGTAELALGAQIAIAVAQPVASAVGRAIAGDSFDVATMAEDALIAALMLGFKGPMTQRLKPACEKLIGPHLGPLLENAAKAAKHAKYDLDFAQQAKVGEVLVQWTVDKILAQSQSAAQAMAHCATDYIKHYKDKPPNPPPSKAQVAIAFIEKFIKDHLSLEFVIHMIGTGAVSLALGQAGVKLKGP